MDNLKTLRTIGFAALGLLSITCSNQGSSSSSSSTNTASTTASSGLSEKQIAEGWKSLFDGKSLAGWQIYQGRKNNTWEAIDGTLHCKAVVEGVPGQADERSDLMTTETFENFDLVFEWKIPAKANSGVMFRVTEEYGQPYQTGPEYQLIDDTGYPETVTELNATAANYAMHATTNKLVKPVGSWNSSRIVANGTHIEHWLNGQKVLEYEIGSEDWKKRVASSKWKEFPGYGMSPSGHIDLQDHGSEVWFRNIFIKSL